MAVISLADSTHKKLREFAFGDEPDWSVIRRLLLFKHKQDVMDWYENGNTKKLDKWWLGKRITKREEKKEKG